MLDFLSSGSSSCHPSTQLPELHCHCETQLQATCNNDAADAAAGSKVECCSQEASPAMPLIRLPAQALLQIASLVNAVNPNFQSLPFRAVFYWGRQPRASLNLWTPTSKKPRSSFTETISRNVTRILPELHSSVALGGEAKLLGEDILSKLQRSDAQMLGLSSSDSHVYCSNTTPRAHGRADHLASLTILDFEQQIKPFHRTPVQHCCTNLLRTLLNEPHCLLLCRPEIGAA